jgi:hypothetical protein
MTNLKQALTETKGYIPSPLSSPYVVESSTDDNFIKPVIEKQGFFFTQAELVQLLTKARMFQGHITTFLDKEGVKYL